MASVLLSLSLLMASLYVTSGLQVLTVNQANSTDDHLAAATLVDFRLPLPVGDIPTPVSSAPSGGPDRGMTVFLTDIQAGLEDDVAPAYSGDGGLPWSPFEMVRVRDMLLHEIHGGEGKDAMFDGPKMLRLAFHDCLGSNGCDGCLDWTGVGTTLWGSSTDKMEDREFEDSERRGSSNGLQPVVEFLEYVYTFDFGKAESCWVKPGKVVGGYMRSVGGVTSVEDCQQLCRDDNRCHFFQMYNILRGKEGQCALFKTKGSSRRQLRREEGSNMIAGYAHCPSETASWSLESRKKSRADLWAFASLLAVEEGIKRHNLACQGIRKPRGSNMCVQREGDDEGCEIWPSRSFTFRTGRKDCVTSQDKQYKAEETDVFPDEHLTGPMVVSYMEDHFGFSAKETVAIMGAHTLGRFHQEKSGHKYVWTTDWQAFNNQYYRNIAARDDWFFDDEECTRVGDAWNNKGHALWVAKKNNVFSSGGPIQWIQKKVVCPNCVAQHWLSQRAPHNGRNAHHSVRTEEDRRCCEDDVPEGAFCRPDGDGPVGSSIFGRDPDFAHGCEYSHFIWGTDEAALSTDMGLMYSFDVDELGYPSGCPGLGAFNPPGQGPTKYQRKERNIKFSDQTCGQDGKAPTGQFKNLEPNEWTAEGCPANCGRQDYKYPTDDMTLSDHVERYADDQDQWIEDFFPVMERMISNGYADSSLVVSWPL